MEISSFFSRPLQPECTIKFYLWFSIRRSSTINKFYNLFWKMVNQALRSFERSKNVRLFECLWHKPNDNGLEAQPKQQEIAHNSAYIQMAIISSIWAHIQKNVWAPAFNSKRSKTLFDDPLFVGLNSLILHIRARSNGTAKIPIRINYAKLRWDTHWVRRKIS